MEMSRVARSGRTGTNRWPQWAALGLLAMAVCLVQVARGTAEELRPYNPPVVRPENLQPTTDSPLPVKPAPVVKDDVYVRFRMAVETMETEQKKVLLEGIAEKRDKAVVGGQLEEAQHYMKLLDTLKVKDGGVLK